MSKTNADAHFGPMDLSNGPEKKVDTFLHSGPREEHHSLARGRIGRPKNAPARMIRVGHKLVPYRPEAE